MIEPGVYQCNVCDHFVTIGAPIDQERLICPKCGKDNFVRDYSLKPSAEGKLKQDND